MYSANAQQYVTPAHTGLLVKGLRELVDGWRDLKSLVEDLPLSLETDVLGPLHEASQVTFWLDIATCTQRLEHRCTVW